MNSVDHKLLKRLARKNLLSEAELQMLEAKFSESQGDLFHKLYLLHMIDDRELTRSYAKACGLPFLDIRKVEPSGEILSLLSEKKCYRYQALPIGFAENRLLVAISNASDVVKLDSLKIEFSSEVQFVITLPSALEELLSQLAYLRASAAKPKPENNAVRESTTMAAGTESGTHGVDSRETMIEVPTLHDQQTQFAGDDDPQDVRTRMDQDEEEDSFHAKQTLLEGRKTSIHSSDTVMLEDEARQSCEQVSVRFALSSPASDVADDEKSVAEPEQSSTEDGSILDELLDLAFKNRADEIEIDHSRLENMATMRLDGYWARMGNLSRTSCSRAVQELRNRLSPDALDRDGNCRQALFEVLVNRQKQRILVTIVSLEERTHARLLITSNIGIQQRPLRLLGDEGSLQPVREILSGKIKGLFLLSGRDEMACWQVLNSIVFETLTNSSKESLGPEVVSWKTSLGIPRLNESVARDSKELTNLLLAYYDRDLQRLAEGNPPNSLFVANYLPTDDSMRAMMPMLENRSVLASISARLPDIAMSILESTLREASKSFKGKSDFSLTSVPFVRAHVWRIPKLCTNCVELRESAPDKLPGWYSEIEPHEFYEAKGCRECGKSGRKGSVWITHMTWRASGFEDDEETMALIDSHKVSASLIRSAHIDIQDLADDVWFFPL